MTKKQIKALKRNGEYWKQRFDALDNEGARYGIEVCKNVEEAFMQAQRDIQRDIDSWLFRLEKNNNVSLYEANKMLVGKELREFKWDVEQYIKYGEENALNGKWIKQLENASAKFHISQLEAVKVRTQQAMERAFGAELDMIDRMAHKVFTDEYYKSAYEIQKGLGVGWRIGEIDQRKLDKIISRPWTADGKTFSDRIWNKKEQMISDLHQELTRNCIYGRPLKDTIKRMEQYVDNSVSNITSAAKRLVVTENAAFRVKGHYEGLKEVGTKKYEIKLTIDGKTCQICREMNGKVFLMSEFQIGLTAPPFHPNCDNGTLVPITEDWDRILNGEEIDDPEFDEWLDKFVGESEEKSRGVVDKSEESGIINENNTNNSRANMTQSTPIISHERQKETLDVTDEYIKVATPKKGTLTFDDEYRESKHKDEIKTANWLFDTFGGNIKLLVESKIRNQNTPDYLWNGKYWELKSTHSINSADKLLQHAIKQIRENPGGVILDLLDDLDIPKLEKQLVGRFLRSELYTLDIMILQKGSLLKIIRHKK